jgi:ADP-ribose pyrophosphatase
MIKSARHEYTAHGCTYLFYIFLNPMQKSDMTHKNWEILTSKIVFERLPWLQILSEDVKLPDGQVVEGYLRLVSPDFVMIVPMNHKQELGLIRSYKHGIKGIDLQPPAGYLEVNEDPLNAAQRELLEETGHQSQDWQMLGAYFISGNQGAGKAHFFLAKHCEFATDPNPGDLEVQETLWIPIPEVKNMWQTGQFQQLSSIAILGLAFSHLK